MIRLQIIVEGQSEETFVNDVLNPHLSGFSISVVAKQVETSRSRGKAYRGGMTTYAKAKRDILRWVKQDDRPDARFSTMFDLYRLPQDFPSYDEAMRKPEPHQKVMLLEEAFQDDIGDPRFIPYIQLYEFEALLLSDPQQFEWQFIEHEVQINQLLKLVSSSASPEEINHGESTAPSKRIIQFLPQYRGLKSSAGPLIAEKIGLNIIRSKCPHFDQWLRQLEQLDTPA